MVAFANATYNRLISILRDMGPGAQQRASESDEYKAFIVAYPLSSLPTLSADQYCVGKGEKSSFCWWLERGLEHALGRYMPGTSRGHIVYFEKDSGAFYKNKLLADLSDEDALRYTLAIQSTIAAADLTQDIRWIDDDAEVFKRAGVNPRVTVGNGRKLRLLASYHPEDVMLISSSDHLAHFLSELGCGVEDIPAAGKPVARMLKLREYFLQAQQMVPGISTHGFMSALYSDALGIAPPPAPAPAPRKHKDDTKMEQDEDLPAPAYLLTWNPENFKLGGDGEVLIGQEQRWTCHSKQPKEGDTVYLVRVGQEPRGIVARGVVTKTSFEAPHWKDSTKQTRYINFRMNEFRPDAKSGLLPMTLLSLAVPDQRWSPQSSGIGIPEHVEPILRKLWHAGDGVHSLRQYTNWSQQDETERRDNWLKPYSKLVELARSLKANPNLIDDSALDALWRSPSNGVTGVGPGAIASKEFQENQALLQDLMGEILIQPDAASLKNVETRWLEAVKAEKLSRLNRAVIRRVFCAVSPETVTSMVKENDCQKLLGIFKRQFELVPVASAGGDWMSLNADIVSCMKQGGLDSQRPIENNIAMWQLVVAKASPADAPADNRSTETAPEMKSALIPPRNLVLYGPPGTGKTYNMVDEALRILVPDMFEGEPSRGELKVKFDEFVRRGQIVFTTFHQSFCYEDFVEGIQATTDDKGKLKYKVADGLFKRLCAGQLSPDHPPFKPGDTFASYTVLKCNTDILELEKRNGNTLPLSITLLNDLADHVRRGDISIEDIRDKNVFEKVADTKLEPYLVNGYANVLPVLVEHLIKLGAESQAPDTSQPKVLIIDEINRGNLSRIFGELITLIEPSKRAGMPEALEVTLPYSKAKFTVPANIHIIGTMNTADRSLTGMDIALRRRFEFREMPPRPDLLDEVFVEGISKSIGDMLRVMNKRIELLLDRDHCLGHAWFMPLEQDSCLERLSNIFRFNVLPLLQEYFFEDWQRIQWVLNDHRKASPDLQFIQKPASEVVALFGADVGINEQSVRWVLNEAAFSNAGAFDTILGATGGM